MADRRSILKSVGAGAATIGIAGCVSEVDDDDDFPSNSIELSVPTPSGSGYDVYARGLAEYMPQYLPNEVEIVVENVTGGALTEHLNHLYQQDPNGYSIGLSSNSVMTQAQMMGRINFTVDELSYLGVLARTTSIIVTRPDTDLNEPEDLEDTEADFAAGPPGTIGYVLANALLDELDSPIELVTGFEDVGDQTAATVRGDTDLNDGSTTAAGIRPGIEDGDLEAILTMRAEPYDGIYDLTDVPTVADIGLDHLDPIGGFDRILIAPPEMSDEIQEILVDAIADTAQDDEFLKAMEEQDSPVEYQDKEAGREANENMLEMLEDYEEYVQQD